jgi:hypothetical protein
MASLDNIFDLPNNRALSFDQGAGCTCRRMSTDRIGRASDLRIHAGFFL